VTSIDIGIGYATDIGAREANADAVAVEQTPRGTGAAVVDGIGSSEAVCRAARRAAETAAVVASHRNAQAALLAAADTMPDYPGSPNAVAAVCSVDPTGRMEIAHCGDAAVHCWSPEYGLIRWTTDQTVGAHVAHMLTGSTLTTAGREALERLGDAISPLGDYVLNGLNYATTSTISWTPLRGDHANPPIVLLTSDGVHKRLTAEEIGKLVGEHQCAEAQVLADALVAAAVAAVSTDPDESVDNATAAVLSINWEA
jgi:serine/threonine protein phosphatase PrpC